MKETPGSKADLRRSQERPGLSDAVLCAVDLPRLLLDDGTFRVTDVITLKDRDGVPLKACPIRCAPHDRMPLDGRGELEADLRGIDAEALVRLSDGTFWIGDENGPSLVHFSADGRLIARHVPQGTEGDFAGAPYETVGSLPAILAKRQANRGIEAVSISPDERFLYFIMQNPLANPDAAAYQRAPQHAAVQDRARDHEGRRRIRLHARRSENFRRDPSQTSRTIRASAK